MDALFFNPDPLTVMSRSLPEHNITDVLDAITSRRYPAFYAALRKYQHLFSPEGAFLLIQQALEYELTIHAFLSILKRCPPVEEFLFSGRADTPFLGIHGLVELAAYLNRTDVLALLLERGVRLTCRIVPGGEHCEASWEKQIPFFIETLMYELNR